MNQAVFNMLCGGGLDSDALAYITAVGITDSAQKTSVNTFVKGLKSNNLWSKLHAVYPFIGGTALKHKWNLKNPLDTNAAFRLTFNGSQTHNSYGIDWADVNTSTANTYFNILTHGSQYDIGVTVYSGLNKSAGLTNQKGTFIGAYNSTVFVLSNQPGRNPVGQIYGTIINNASGVSSPALGAWNHGEVLSLNRTANNYESLYRDGVKLKELTTTESANAPNANIFLNNITADQGGYNGNSRMQFAAIHQGLQDSEVVIFTNLINSLQQGLSRSYNILNPTYVHLGDSITWGQAATTHGHCWTSLLANNKIAYEYNLGVAGYTSSNIVATSLALTPNKTSTDRYIFCAVGTNDVRGAGVTLEAYMANILTIYNSLISKGYDNSNIIIPTLYKITSYGGGSEAKLLSFNAAIEQFWTDHNLTIHADVYNNAGDYSGGDGIHPDNAYYARIANYYISLLT